MVGGTFEDVALQTSFYGTSCGSDAAHMRARVQMWRRNPVNDGY